MKLGVGTLCLIGLVAGCGKPKSATPEEVSTSRPEPAEPDVVLATVNGTPITQLDVDYWLAKNSQGRITEGTPEQVANILEALISQELIRQRAVEIGLDTSPEHQRKIRAKRAEVDAFLRTELRSDYFAYRTREAATLAGGEAKQFFDEHADQIRTRYHVHQILKSSEAEIQEVERRLAEGDSFADASGLATRDLSVDAPEPWDVGRLHWLQLPEVWRDAVDDLEVGQTSGILRGPSGKRFWIIKLVDKEEDPTVTFESVRSVLVTAIQREKVEAMRAGLDDELRGGADIVYARETGAQVAAKPR